MKIGRNACFFAGSLNATKMTAARFSFMKSRKKNNINVFEWLKDVFKRIQNINHKNFYQLLPSTWNKHRTK